MVLDTNVDVTNMSPVLAVVSRRSFLDYQKAMVRENTRLPASVHISPIMWSVKPVAVKLLAFAGDAEASCSL